MSERDVTMAMCPHCEQLAQPSLHTTVQCLDNMRRQRDEARKWAENFKQTAIKAMAEREQLWEELLALKETTKR